MNHIVVHSFALAPQTAPCSYPATKRIALNANWENQREIPFQLAHEMGHIFCQHNNCAALYHSCYKQVMELEADTTAVQLILPIYDQLLPTEQMNATDFIAYFGIPEYLKSMIQQEFKIYLTKKSGLIL